MPSWIDPLDNKVSTLKYKSQDYSVKINNLNNTLAGNRIFSKDDIDYYNHYSRYGFIDPYNTEQVVREFLFFTKPDLNIFNLGYEDEKADKPKLKPYGILEYEADLHPYLQTIPFFVEANIRHKDALRQLQYSVMDADKNRNPFMYLLSNSVTSKLDLPGITAESRESTPNIMGTSIQYRGHSYKSDNGYDFSLSFNDTAYLEIYTMLKAYDEYMRLIKTGEIEPKRDYIINRIIPEQFSIYKFLVGNDGETILFYAKLTGCYFTDVPRSDLSDPGTDGIKYSVGFHAQFVEDSNPMIINEFNRLSPGGSQTKYADTYNYEANTVDNSWVKWPKIVAVSSQDDLQVKRRGTGYDYRMKWIK